MDLFSAVSLFCGFLFINVALSGINSHFSGFSFRTRGTQAFTLLKDLNVVYNVNYILDFLAVLIYASNLRPNLLNEV